MSGTDTGEHRQQRRKLHRKTDPPGRLGDLALALIPWLPLLNLALGIGAGTWVVLRFMGVTIGGPSDTAMALARDVKTLRVEIATERQERRLADSLSVRERNDLRALQALAAQQANEILLVVCTGLADSDARRIPACRRVLYGTPPALNPAVFPLRPEPTPTPRDHVAHPVPHALPAKRFLVAALVADLPTPEGP